MSENAIKITDLRKTYRSGLFSKKTIEALKGVSFSVKKGEVFGILGPNGAGKTTLIKSLLGILKHKGDISICGERSGSLAARRKSGYLPENIRLPEYLTGEQCLMHFGQISGLSTQFIKNRMDPLIERVGMTEAAKRKTSTYSKGMLQRIGLATASISDPEVLFLDEPTDGLDPVGRRDVRDLLKEICSTGKTVVVNSHLLHELELICDRVAVLQKGELLTVRNTKELTEESKRVIFEVSSITQSQFDSINVKLSDLEMKFQSGDSSDEINIANGSQKELDALVDSLRAEKISIRQIKKDQQSLEQAFLGLLGEEQ